MRTTWGSFLGRRTSARVAAWFTPPAYQALRDLDPVASQSGNKAFANWMRRNVKPHKMPGYAAVVLSLKKTGKTFKLASVQQHFMIEQQVGYVARALDLIDAQGATTLEVRPEAVAREDEALRA